MQSLCRQNVPKIAQRHELQKEVPRELPPTPLTLLQIAGDMLQIAVGLWMICCLLDDFFMFESKW